MIIFKSNRLKRLDMTSIDAVTLKLEAISLFRRVKKYYKYKELKPIFNMHIPLLSKYAKGKLLPGKKRAVDIIKKCKEIIKPEDEVRKEIFRGIYNYPEFSNLCSRSPELLLYITIQVYKQYKDNSKINKILTIEGGGLIIASILSILLNKGLVYALRDHFVEDSIVESFPESSRFLKYKRFIALPKKAISCEDRLLILDDIAWRGETIKALLRIVKRIGAKVEDIYIVNVYSKDLVKDIMRTYNVSVHYLIELAKG